METVYDPIDPKDMINMEYHLMVAAIMVDFAITLKEYPLVTQSLVDVDFNDLLKKAM